MDIFAYSMLCFTSLFTLMALTMGYPKDRHTLPLDALRAESEIPSHNKHNFQNRRSQLVESVCHQYIYEHPLHKK